MILKDNELKNIHGGISAWGLIGLGGLVTFLAGIINGIVHPFKCN